MGQVRSSIRLSLLRRLGRFFTSPPATPLTAEARILIIRPDHVGDVLLTTPAIALLRRSLPSAHLAALVGPWSAEVIRRGPPIDALSTCEFPGFSRRRPRWFGAAYLELRRARDLRRHRFDVAIVARPDHWWGALLAAIAGIPHRVGFNVPECAPFLTEGLEAPDGAHSAELSLMLARRVCELAGVITNQRDPRPVFSVTQAERAGARDALARLELVRDGPLVVLHPGAGTELKLWPPERWARTLDLVRHRWDARTLIVSTHAEQPVVASIQRAAEAAHQHLSTDQGLGFLSAILEQADIVLGSDSGPLHLATTMGTATVRIYGPTDPAIFGPWPPADRQVVLRALVPCSPCGHVVSPPCGASTQPLCLLEQSPESVVESVDWLLRTPMSAEAASK